MSSRTPTRRLDQLMVARLVEVLNASERDPLDVRARARSLPTMLRRHGPVPVLLFLAGKEGGDRELGDWLLEGIAAVLHEVDSQTLEGYAKSLAGMSLEHYLLHWQTAVEAAGWLKRLVEARSPEVVPAGGRSGG